MSRLSRGGRGLRSVANSLAAKALVLILIFVACPSIVYVELRAASQEKTELLLQSIQQQGRLIALSLRPYLSRSHGGALPALQKELSQIASGTTKVKVFFRPDAKAPAPSSGGFFYVASAPPVSTAYLDKERRDLVRTGVFNELKSTCEGTRALALRYTNPAGEWELLSSLTPLHTKAGCWLVLTSVGRNDAAGLAISQPYWERPEVKVAAAIYLFMAVLALSLFFGVWRSLRRFSRLAREIGFRKLGERGSFRALNRVPELAGVAGEFDRMVNRLASSSQAIRDAAEENAHAFKTPIAVIFQSLEPLNRALSSADDRTRRALHLIEKSSERLDLLVQAARQMEEALADLVNPPREPVDLSALLGRMIEAYGETAALADKRVRGSVEEDVVVAGGADMFEIVIENLLDNALSFTPGGTEVIVSLVREGDVAVLEIADHGPGVPPDDLERIFERYYSSRRTGRPGDGVGTGDSANGGAGQGGEPPAGHFGMGLWVVRRNIEAIGGDIRAENRAGGGLRIAATLPVWQ